MEVKPKIVLNGEYLAMINRFYNTQIDSQLLNWPCFSQPQLSSHACNVFAKLPGEQDCDYCDHIPYRECSVMCYIHHFCLASFAARLNLQHVKGEPIKKTIIGILKKWKYPTLNKRVVGTLDLISGNKHVVGEKDGVSTYKAEDIQYESEDKMPEVSEKVSEVVEPKSAAPESAAAPPEPIVEPIVGPPPINPSSLELPVDPEPGSTPEPVVEPVPEPAGVVPGSRYTVKQIAEKFGCSEGLICRYISEGGKNESGTVVKLICEKEGNRRFISQEALDAFENAGIKRRKRRTKSEMDTIRAEETGKSEAE